jgi:hypothetical protein
MNACRGCPDQARTVQTVSLRWVKQLDRVFPSTKRGRLGADAAIEAFQHYGYAANSASLTYTEYQTHPGESAHYKIYLRQYKQAQAYATRAVRLLQINIPIIP